MAQIQQQTNAAAAQEAADPSHATQIQNELFQQVVSEIAPVDPQLAADMEARQQYSQQDFGQDPIQQQMTEQQQQQAQQTQQSQPPQSSQG